MNLALGELRGVGGGATGKRARKGVQPTTFAQYSAENLAHRTEGSTENVGRLSLAVSAAGFRWKGDAQRDTQRDRHWLPR
jgi:hypothetical protein